MELHNLKPAKGATHHDKRVGRGAGSGHGGYSTRGLKGVVLVSFAGLREAVGFVDCPKAFRGIPIKLITDALMALALLGFYGLHLE